MLPLPQQSRFNPAGETAILCGGDAADLGAQHRVRELDGAQDGSGDASIAVQAEIPVEVWRPGFQRHRNVHKPEWTPPSVGQQVVGQQAKMILWRGNKNLLASQ